MDTVQKEKLEKIKKNNELEFKYHLRNLIKRCETIEELWEIIILFKIEISQESYFYIDQINRILFIYLSDNSRNMDNEKYLKIIKILEFTAPIGDKDTKDILNYIIKKCPKESSFYPLLMNLYAELEHRLMILEKKLPSIKIAKPKNIMVEWYE
ncbi:MAG TPA: hypothetical protein PKW55_02605 [Spirochaetota bacterium]|nr:hypothetical protein [Spirochaetota bacterium]HOM38260.1 hypothetical protein [Spirochaetota bacterium]HPQ48522.1 hypothetical protein [Spirochaetota bacterium]